MPVTPWKVPAGAWAGETAFLLGGGPSLAAVPIAALDAARAEGRARVVAIKHAVTLMPHADCCYFADGLSRWYKWYGALLRGYHGPWLVTVAPDLDAADGLDIKRLVWRRAKRGEPPPALSCDPGALVGEDSGTHATNLAFLAGAARIVLCGFDLRDNGWWHSHPPKQPVGKLAARIETVFLPAWRRMLAALAAEGVEVLSASPGSALGLDDVRVDDLLAERRAV